MPLLGCHLAQTGVASDAGSIDQYVHTAVFGFDPRNELPAAVEVGDVDRFEADRLAQVGDVFVELGDALFARSQVYGNHPASGLCQVAADFCAQTTDTAGDNRDALVSDRCTHGLSNIV